MKLPLVNKCIYDRNCGAFGFLLEQLMDNRKKVFLWLM